MKVLRAVVIVSYFGIATLPLAWLALTSIKTYDDTISAHAKFIPLAKQAGSSAPAAASEANSAAVSPDSHAGSEARSQADSDDGSARFTPTLDAYRSLSRPVAGTPANFYHYLGNSIIIGLLSTLAAVCLGTICAYGFSRFKIPGSKDWLFFILSTRFLPPLAVVVPVLVMYRWFALENTHVGLILLYTSFNLSLAVWLMKGFVDEIPRAFEEAALVDGYSRLRTFVMVIVPQAATGMAVTGVFCLISSWNEFGFAMTLNNTEAKTVPVYFAGLQGNIEGVPWPQIAAGMMIFVAPIIVFTVLVRRHLLRGVTFGTIKQ